MTITKMILFNMDRLLNISKQVQQAYLDEVRKDLDKDVGTKKENSDLLTHKMQIILMDEDQLELLVKLLTFNEQNGEMVNKIYEILINFVEISKSSSQAIQNISVLDMSKGLL